jgi:hypothetical protein
MMHVSGNILKDNISASQFKYLLNPIEGPYILEGIELYSQLST